MGSGSWRRSASVRVRLGPAMHATFEKTSVFAERRAIAVLAPMPSVEGARAREWHGRGPYGPGCAVSPRVLVCKVLLFYASAQ